MVGSQVYRVLEQSNDTRCNAIESEAHLLKRILVNKESINVCVFCSLKIENENYCYYSDKCKHSLCYKCFDLIVHQHTPLRLNTSDLIVGLEQKTKNQCK